MHCLNCKKFTPNFKFCCRNCADIYRRKNKKVKYPFIYKCLNCGKSVRSSKFCDTKCQGEFRKKTIITKIENNENVKGVQLRKYLIEKNGEICEKCGWNEINKFTKKVPLEMHHIDRNYKNNVRENVQLLCPNCHSLTEFFRNAFGIKSTRSFRRKKIMP